MFTVSERLNFVEKAFNIAGSIPLIGVISGFIRTALGNLQFDLGVAIGAAGLSGQLIHPGSERMENLAKEGGEQILHGTLNMIRGIGEAIAAATVIGSIIPFTIQVLSSQGFEPRFSYPSPKARQLDAAYRS